MSLEETIDNVAEAYKCCRDISFVLYMNTKYESYCDGTLDFDVYQFMAMALVYYNAKLTNGEWCDTLSSQVDSLKSQLTKATTSLSSQTEMKEQLRLAHSNNKKKPFDRKFKNKKNSSFKSFQKKDEEWKKQPPANGESDSKVVCNKTFHWCIHHMCWCIHKPEDCLLGRERQGSQ